MSPHLRPDDERLRLARLDSYAIFGAPPDPEFDEIARLGAEVFQTPFCLIAITGEEEHWLLARREFPRQSLVRTGAFCCYAFAADGPFVCLDAAQDPRFAGHPLVTGEPHIRFYAGAALIDSDGARLGVLCVVDRTPRERFSEREVELLSTLARIVSTKLEKRRKARDGTIVQGFAEANSLATVATDHVGRITFWNPAAERMFGRSRDEVVGRSIEIIMPERFRAQHAAGMRRMTESGESRLAGKSVEVVGVDGAGREFPIEITISSWPGARGREYGAHVQDISERKIRERRLEHLARHDPLTGLLNKAAFGEEVARLLGEHGTATAIRLDLHRFKSINETFGHDVGDALLQTVALRLRSCLDETAIVGRVGADDFAALLPHDDEGAAREVAARLLALFESPFHVSRFAIPLAAAIGLAFAPAHAVEAEDLLARAEFAMLGAKPEARSACRAFDDSMANQLAARRAFKDELRRATVRGEWELFYQPQVALDDMTLSGCEALLRWRHPQRGLLSPAAFMPTLETHLIAFDVGRWTLDEACRQLAAWRAEGRDVPRIAVNLFAAHFHSGALKADVEAALARNGLSPEDLEIEITETIALNSDDDAMRSLSELRDMGVGLALDDFGTGFASLSTLKRFPVSRLKIDRSFVQDICDNAMGRAIVEAVASIGRSLSIEVVAEGIERDEQAQMVRRLGCQIGQGFLYSKPQAADALFGQAAAGFSERARAVRSLARSGA
ncbi:putative bifunctional diguanylate cyclase/phosphodiesterase [Chenggangzhangella methanolivorans]|uniref:putative bifunctional diguanylate cyclase/phosphodiesterase n=1 Tax=Chenggangzhangella methanolivorans TaxID=1437009 RepID=UPI00360806DA